jgi:hypothetical protein
VKELASMEKFLARNESVPTVKLKISDADPHKIGIDYDDQGLGLALLLDAVGTADLDFYNGLISQLGQVNLKAGKSGEIDKCGLDFMLSVIKDVRPRNQLEAMLAAQMAAVHLATMTMARRLAISETILEQDSTERAFNKLTRTFASQMETLKRYRSDGPHTVQNVSIADGGQAVVANVTNSSGDTKRSETVSSGPVAAKANGRANGFSLKPTKERISPKRVFLRPPNERIADIGQARKH